MRRDAARPPDLRGLPQLLAIQSDDQTGITDYLNDVAKYVVSTTMTDPQWKNSTVIASDRVRRVRD